MRHAAHSPVIVLAVLLALGPAAGCGEDSEPPSGPPSPPAMWVIQGGWVDQIRYSWPRLADRFFRPFQRFSARAHANGFEVIITPHQSLMSVPGGRCGAEPHETETDAYIRCDIAGQAARFADVVETQAQGMQATPDDYRSFVVATALQARLANPSVRVISGLTANGASAQQMYAAWDSVRDVVDGFYLALAVGSYDRIPAVVRFLRMLPSS